MYKNLSEMAAHKKELWSEIVVPQRYLVNSSPVAAIHLTNYPFFIIKEQL